MKFVSISHTVTGRFSQHLVKWLMPTREWFHNILGAMRQTSGSESALILKSGFKFRITLFEIFGLGGGLCSVSKC